MYQKGLKFHEFNLQSTKANLKSPIRVHYTINNLNVRMLAQNKASLTTCVVLKQTAAPDQLPVCCDLFYFIIFFFEDNDNVR